MDDNQSFIILLLVQRTEPQIEEELKLNSDQMTTQQELETFQPQKLINMTTQQRRSVILLLFTPTDLLCYRFHFKQTQL